MAARPIDAPFISRRERFALPQNSPKCDALEVMEERMEPRNKQKRSDLLNEKEKEITIKAKKNVNRTASNFRHLITFQDWLQELWNSADDRALNDLSRKEKNRSKLDKKMKKVLESRKEKVEPAKGNGVASPKTEETEDDLFDSLTNCLMIDSMGE